MKKFLKKKNQKYFKKEKNDLTEYLFDEIEKWEF